MGFLFVVGGGALFAGGLDYGIQVYNNYQAGKRGWDAWTSICWGSVGISALSGGTAAAVSFFAGPWLASIFGLSTRGLIIAGMIEGSLSDVAATVVLHLVTGRPITAESLFQAAIGGMPGGAAGAVAGQLLRGGRRVLTQAPTALLPAPRARGRANSIGTQGPFLVTPEGTATSVRKLLPAPRVRPQSQSSITTPSRIFVGPNGRTIPQFQEGSLFRANVVTPDIDESISRYGFLSGYARGVTRGQLSDLAPDAPFEERVIEFVGVAGGKRFPRNANVVGLRSDVGEAIRTALGTGAETLSDPNAYVRVDEIRVSPHEIIDVAALFNARGLRPRYPPIEGEFSFNGSIPPERIINTMRFRP